ncbi:hypothetical protein P3X46_002421 [Hevea brasiliensis]|uniref:R13L1/DRL21-like LRR repeat region domain-containing protein n=2 Tax=Hevea brasiliensis TaxID=3981 RepID=A0ABQ9N2X2_HEVBR|nr:hypothetical protein P3X46_002421 [Hevea brasiliensis]
MVDPRHLNIKDCTGLTHLPDYIGLLKNLQTLPPFIVGQRIENGLFQLNSLRLQGELKMEHLENVSLYNLPRHFDWRKRSFLSDTEQPFLNGGKLYSLALSWGDINASKLNRYMPGQLRQTENDRSISAETIIDKLRPNNDIRRLLINGYQGTRFLNWMNLNTLGDLTRLELFNCPRCESLPTVGESPALKVLHIQGMDSVLRISREFYGEGRRPFSSLNELSLRDFPNFQSWESIDQMEAFTCLNRLIIVNCPRLTNMQWFSSLRYLEMRNCNPLMLRSAA